jgi:ketosteroid isomerase-like protein
MEIMRYRVFSLLIFLAAYGLAAAGETAANPDAAIAEVAPLLAEMGAAANAHDVERHVDFFAHDPSVTFIFNGEPSIGWETIRDKQREVWRNGKSDVVYTMQGKPTFLVPATGLVVTTIFLRSHRTLPNGQIADGEFAVTSIWQRRPEGWRVIYSHESTTR